MDFLKSRVYCTNKGLVKIFMENAAILRIDLNIKNNFGTPTLHRACRNGKSYLVKIFMDYAGTYGIDLNRKNNNGLTLVYIALRATPCV